MTSLVFLTAVGACGPAGPASSAVATGTAEQATSPPAPSPTASSPVATVEAPPHIMVVVLENREYGTALAEAPRLRALAATHGLATEAYAMSHPSEPNYLALITGSTQGVTDDGDHLVDAPSLAGQLTRAGVGWRAYMGGMPTPCDRAPAVDGYAKKHDPFLLVREVASDERECASVVPQTTLARDLSSGTAPAFLWVSPDLCADGHDCATAEADAATATLVGEVTASGWYARGAAIVVLWDEGVTTAGCCEGAAGGHVAVIVVSAALRPGTTLATRLDDAGVLRGIEEVYGLPPLGKAACPCSGDLLPLLRPAA
ncbi:MAG TPA: alkaline phosphatase family protein [Candidatus Dormibacteraeota bacterium]|nr:alkaline phosphatase family protein [Candidatus Dormibacteraeota bacterium]